MSRGLERFLGDTPIRAAIKLLVLSVVVGVVMRVFNWTPRDVFSGITRFFRNIWELGFDAFASSLEYLLLGAAVVVPAFLILRLLTFRSGGRPRE